MLFPQLQNQPTKTDYTFFEGGSYITLETTIGTIKKHPFLTRQH